MQNEVVLLLQCLLRVISFLLFIGSNLSQGSTLVDLRESTFTDNSASEGAALIALEEMNFVYSTTSFTGNTATNGGDVASMPTSLRLKIYSFESYFLFVDDITAKDLLSDSKTVKLPFKKFLLIFTRL